MATVYFVKRRLLTDTGEGAASGRRIVEYDEAGRRNWEFFRNRALLREFLQSLPDDRPDVGAELADGTVVEHPSHEDRVIAIWKVILDETPGASSADLDSWTFATGTEQRTTYDWTPPA